MNGLIAAGHYGRLFAVVHFASKQWKVTSEDLIMMDNVLEAECGDRIRMEKVMCLWGHSACGAVLCMGPGQAAASIP